MVSKRIESGLLVGILALGGTTLGVGAGAAVAGSARPVVSDKISFDGIAALGPHWGYHFTSNNCQLTSDSNSGAVQCHQTAQFTLSSAGTGAGTAQVTSSDGSTSWRFTLTPAATDGCKMSGHGTEVGSSETATAPYPATVLGIVKVIPAKHSARTNASCSSVPNNLFVTGQVTVSEGPTAP